MRVHHLNCISSCPLGGKLFDGRTPGLLRRGELTCHCLLVETGEGLVLIDTGFGLRDVADPRSRLSAFFLLMLKPDFREEMTALRQIERLGFSASDVRHIVLSHLDFDHAGGLDDFPHAKVHMLRIERDYAVRQQTGSIGSASDLNNGRRRRTGNFTMPPPATAGMASNACGRSRIRWTISHSCRSEDTPSVMRASRYARKTVGCCWRPTRISFIRRWISNIRAVHRDWRSING